MKNFIVNPITSPPFIRYTYTHVRPSGESLTNCVDLLSVEVGQSCCKVSCNIINDVQIKANDVGRACRTHFNDDTYVSEILIENLKARSYF